MNFPNKNSIKSIQIARYNLVTLLETVTAMMMVKDITPKDASLMEVTVIVSRRSIHSVEDLTRGLATVNVTRY